MAIKDAYISGSLLCVCPCVHMSMCVCFHVCVCVGGAGGCDCSHRGGVVPQCVSPVSELSVRTQAYVASDSAQRHRHTQPAKLV